MGCGVFGQSRRGRGETGGKLGTLDRVGLGQHDLARLERPANAISMPRMGGSAASDPAAQAKRHSRANSLRPASMSAGVKGEAGVSDGASTALTTKSPLRLCHFFF